MRKYSIAIAVLAVTVAGGWYYASPLLAIAALGDAVTDGDAGALEEHIDFPSLRVSVNLHLHGVLADQSVSTGSQLMVPLDMDVADKMINTIVDELVTPLGIAKMMQWQRSLEKEGDGPFISRDFEIDRVGLSKFTFYKPNDVESPVFIFKRSGTGWKLKKIDLPRNHNPNLRYVIEKMYIQSLESELLD